MTNEGRTTWHAPDIECEGCATSIKRALGRLDGVENVAVDIASKQVTVGYDPERARPEQIESALNRAGFPPERR